MAIHEDGDLLVADDEGHISKLKKDAMDTGTRPLGPGQTGPGCELELFLDTRSSWWFHVFFFLIFHPLIGENDPNLTHILQMG